MLYRRFLRCGLEFMQSSNDAKTPPNKGKKSFMGLSCEQDEDNRLDPPPPEDEPSEEGLPPEDDEWFPGVVRPWEVGKMDAGGVRINASGIIVGGVNANIDILGNTSSNEISVFFTPGLMVGAAAGVDASIGLIEVANLPNNEAYQGISLSGGGAAAASLVGGSVEFGSVPPAIDPRPIEEKPQTWFGSYSAGAEVGVYVSPGYALEVIRFSSYDGSVITVLPQIQNLLGIEP